jgi:hypothetical protein
MATDLSPAEREDREAERLLDHKPAPSRKNRDRRAPRPYQRRRRVRDDDPDLKKSRGERGGSTLSDRDLDRLLSDMESVTGDGDGDDDYEDFDFDSVIDALSDGGDVPPEVLRRMVDESGSDSVADLLRGTERSLDFDRSRADELDRALGLSATSYGRSVLMSAKTGAYHGVRDVRGNPTDSPNTVSLPDRRYFTDKDYDVIVKFAGKLLASDDWLKYGWDDGAEDAPLRAALDIAIQTANGNAYQSKIDPETYDLLLNRLAKWGYDTFSDTVLPMEAPSGDSAMSRRAGHSPQSNSEPHAMKNTDSYKQIVQVANDLRGSNPVASLNILRNLRSLFSSDAEAPQSISDAVSSSRASVAASPSSSESPDVAEVPLKVLIRAAASSAAMKAALGPYILAAAKKKKGKGKGKGKIPPQFLKNVKGKGDAPPKGKNKKASIAAEDASW